MYHVVNLPEVGAEVDVNMHWLLALLKKNHVALTKSLVFNRRIKYLTETYEMLDEELREQGHDGDEGDDRSRIFEMYHLKTDDDVKNNVLCRFNNEGGNLRLVLCSTSFSMGLDVPDVGNVFHYGPPNDTDDFLQETGRAGRNGEESHSVILMHKCALCGAYTTTLMKEYVRTKLCRRKVLLSAYMEAHSSRKPGHMCCDNCAAICDCGDCPTSST